MTFLIDNNQMTTLASLIANNELDAATIQELKDLEVNMYKSMVCPNCKEILILSETDTCKCGFVFKKRLMTKHAMKSDSDNIRVGYGSHTANGGGLS